MRLFSTTGEGDSGGAIAFSTRIGAGSSDTDYGTERMRIDSSGNVGIGTGSPGTKLNMKGGVFLAENQASTNTQILYYDGAGAGNNNNSYTIANAKFGTGIFVNDTGTTGSTITLVNKEGANNVTKHASIGFVNTDMTDNGKFGGQIGFWPEDANATKQQFRIYTSGESAGYNLPVQRMVVTGDGDVMIPGRLALGTSTASSSQFYVSAPGNGTSTSTGDFHINNSGTMTLYGTRPWVTTTNAGHHTGKLCSINLHANAHQPAIEWIRDTGQGTNQKNWLLRQENDDALYTWYYDGSNWSIPMYVKSNALIAQVNVGIGTASPNENLEIYGTGIRIHDPSSSPKLDFVRGGTSRVPATQTFGQSDYSDWRITANGMNLSFQNQWTGGNSGNLLTAMTLAHSTGNVGIGTTSPQEKFHLYGSPIIQHETRYNAGGTSGWYKIGTWDAASTDSGARLKISLLGCEGYSAGGVDRGGETIIYASINNNSPTNVSNMSGSIHAHGRPVITQAKFKQYGSDRSKYEIIAYVETFTQHSMKIECTETSSFTRAWTTASDPGSDSATVQAALFTHVVDNGGNVGINDTTPGYKLSVNGSFRVSGGNTSTFGSDGLLHINSRSTQYGSETVALQTTIDGRALTESNPGTHGSESRNVLALQPDGGYVGVGVTSPSTNLQIGNTSSKTSDTYLTIASDGGSSYSQGIRLIHHGTDDSNMYGWRIRGDDTDDKFHINRISSGSNNTSAITIIGTNSYVGIGETSPSYKLHVAGAIYATGNITAYSDRRAKSNIEKIKNPLEKINKISGYTYTMKTEDNLDKRYTGLIAQEVLEILPEAVAGSEDTQYSLAYGNMVGILVEAIKELKLEIDELKRSR
jgi:hypothetical protein